MQHIASDVNTTAFVRAVEAEFCDVDSRQRPTFLSRGRVCRNNRDAIWYGIRSDVDGMMPLYRVFNVAYGHPKTRAGIARATRVKEMPEWMRKVLHDLSKRHNIDALNHVVLHRYVDGKDTIGFHHDKYMDIKPGSTIVSLSLGCERTFAMRYGRTVVKYPVRDGDVVLLPYDVNKKAKHAILKSARTKGVRYSITARCIDTHYDEATGGHRYTEDIFHDSM